MSVLPVADGKAWADASGSAGLPEGEATAEGLASAGGTSNALSQPPESSSRLKSAKPLARHGGKQDRSQTGGRWGEGVAGRLWMGPRGAA
jgi:hypothetical protein